MERIEKKNSLTKRRLLALVLACVMGVAYVQLSSAPIASSEVYVADEVNFQIAYTRNVPYTK